jgi:hypothetical protein
MENKESGIEKIYLVRWADVTGRYINIFLNFREAIEFSLEKKSRVITKNIKEPFLQDIGNWFKEPR